MPALFARSPNALPATPARLTVPFCAAVLASFAAMAFASSPALAWGFEDTAAIARQNAASPYQAPSLAVPAELAKLDYDGYRDIRFNTAQNLWRGDVPSASPIEANFFHVGPGGDSVRVNEITADGIKPIPYDSANFTYGKNTVSPQTWPDLGWGGVRFFAHLNSPVHKDELVVFQGASYFRALGAGQRYGLSARGLAIDTAGAEREEFPRFTDFWLQRPQVGSQRLTVYALMDSERVTGAYRFDIDAGSQTQMAVAARIFMRSPIGNGNDKPVKTLGIAPLTSMFLFGENQPLATDFRPEVHDSDGLMMATGDGEWLWRPLQNPRSTLVTSFAMASVKGFGLMQRDRNFDRYEDTEARYELRPSAWVTPVGSWGPGRVELLQFSTPDETHDNVAAYWVPDQLPAPGESLDLSYTIAWQGQAQQLPPNGWVTQSRRGTGYSKLTAAEQAQRINFVIDFAGPALDALPEGAAVKAVATAGDNGRVIESIAYKNPVNGQWRVSLRVEKLDSAKPVELRAFLQHDNHTLSETWTNLITP